MPASAIIGKTAPELEISHWLQGETHNLHALRGKVVLVVIFQVNCPGCFLHALPTIAELHKEYAQRGLHVIALATAFEDFELNSLENLRLLVDHGELCGAPLTQLGNAGLLKDKKLGIELPFAIAMDKLSENTELVDELTIRAFIDQNVPDYATLSTERQQIIQQRASEYLHARSHRAHTFEQYQLQGTPSTLLIDREGILRDVSFGHLDHLAELIKPLLQR